MLKTLPLFDDGSCGTVVTVKQKAKILRLKSFVKKYFTISLDSTIVVYSILSLSSKNTYV